MVRIIRIDYNPESESLDIFCSGCLEPYCKGCFNMEAADFSKGDPYTLEHRNKIYKYLDNFKGLIKRILLVGGSWTHQVDYEHVLQDLSLISTYSNVPIYLFAREQLDQIPQPFKDICHYIKTGEYIPELTCDDNISYGIKLATSNQRIYRKVFDY